MGLPGCSKQRAGDRAPQLGAGDPFGVRAWHSLSDKDLEVVADDPVENGLRSGGGMAILLEDHGRRPFLQRLKVVAISLAICPAFICFVFFEKFLGYAKLWGHCVDLDIEPQSDPRGSTMCTSALCMALCMGRTLPGQAVHLA